MITQQEDYKELEKENDVEEIFLKKYINFISLSYVRGLKVCIQSCYEGSLVIRFCVVGLLTFFGHEAYGILVPQPEIGPAPSTVESQNLNHWTIREVPKSQLKQL